MPIAPRIQALKARCKAAGVPVIYANDSHGRWRSDFRFQCVLTSAADARLHDYEVTVAADCIASQSAERHARSLQHLREAMGVEVTPSAELDLARR